jgi:hypothetical protein
MPQLEIKAFLESVHGMEVERVNTINYQGKKKTEVDPRGKPHYYRSAAAAAALVGGFSDMWWGLDTPSAAAAAVLCAFSGMWWGLDIPRLPSSSSSGVQVQRWGPNQPPSL